jgi:hypothetical protein
MELTGLQAGNQIRERSLEGVCTCWCRTANEGLLLQPTWEQVLLTDSQKKRKFSYLAGACMQAKYPFPWAAAAA